MHFYHQKKCSYKTPTGIELRELTFYVRDGILEKDIYKNYTRTCEEYGGKL